MCIMRVMIAAAQADEKTIALLAAEAQVDPRTARRALAEGVGAVRGRFVKDRLRQAAAKLKIKL